MIKYHEGNEIITIEIKEPELIWDEKELRRIIPNSLDDIIRVTREERLKFNPIPIPNIVKLPLWQRIKLLFNRTAV